MIFRRLALVTVLLVAGAAACGGGKSVESAEGLTNLIRVHDTVVAAGRWGGDAGLSLLEVIRRRCAIGDGDGQVVEVSFLAPWADASRRSASAFLDEALTDDLGVRTHFQDNKASVYALDSAKKVPVASVGVVLTSACLDGPTPQYPGAGIGAIDPLAMISAIRDSHAVPADGWDENRRSTSPIGPDQALKDVEYRFDEAATALRTVDRTFAGDDIKRVLDRTGCGRPELTRVVATVELDDATAPAGITAWQQLPKAPWTIANWMGNEPPFAGPTPPAATTPPGPPILLGAVEARGGVLLRGTPAKTTLQVISPCAKFATDPALAKALGLS